MTARPNYAAYVINLTKKDDSPFKPKSDEEKVKEEKSEDKKDDKAKSKKPATKKVVIDFDGIARRIMALPLRGNYNSIIAGQSGFAFISEGATLHKFDLKKLKAVEFGKGLRVSAISTNGKHMVVRAGRTWKVANTSGPNAKAAKNIEIRF